MGGKFSRSKGARGERKACELLRDTFPDVKRHLEFQEAEALGYDLDNTGQLRIQVKNYKGYAPISKLFEVQANGGELPVLLTMADRKPAVVAMRLDDFLKILEDVGVVYE